MSSSIAKEYVEIQGCAYVGDHAGYDCGDRPVGLRDDAALMSALAHV
ncbi:MAG: hypothetical protein JWM53_6018 [bacterium]|nr:hypothetical protein [bacterium]